MRHLRYVLTVDQNSPFRRFQEPRYQVNQCRLARARLTYQRNAFALLDLQGKRLQRWNILARVNNRHILKRNSATARLNQQIRTIVLLPFSIYRIEDALGCYGNTRKGAVQS